MDCCVYWIHTKNHTDLMSQGYVGVSNNAEKRFSQHNKRTQNRHLRFAIKKYNWDNLIKTVLLVADKSYCLEIERKLRPANAIGWNIVAGGGLPPVITGPRPHLRGKTSWNKGKTLSEKTKELLREASLEQWKDPEHKKRMSLIKKGKPSNRKGYRHSPETIKKMKDSKTGKPSKKKGTKLSAESYENVVQASRFKWTCPHCKKEGMNKGAANRWHFDSCKNKENL